MSLRRLLEEGIEIAKRDQSNGRIQTAIFSSRTTEIYT